MRNAIITWASGKDFCRTPEFNVFFKSLERADVDAECLIFTHDMDEEIRQNFLSQGHDIIDVDPDRVHYLLRDRFLHWHEWLCANGHKFDYVLLADSKDILWQADPFDFLKEFFVFNWRHNSLFDCEEFVLLCGEGGKHYQSEWNSHQQFICQMDTKDFDVPFTDKPIINGGFILGTPQAVRDWIFKVWIATLKTKGACCDQPVMNYLYFFLEKDPTYFLIEPCAWPLCATGEAIKRNWMDPEPFFKNGRLYHPDEKLFKAFHQWERTIYKDEILKQFELKEQNKHEITEGKKRGCS